LIFDNVDRDYHNKDNSQAYSIKDSSFEIRLEFPSVHVRAFTTSAPFGNRIDEVGHMEALEGAQPATGQTEVVEECTSTPSCPKKIPFRSMERFVPLYWLPGELNVALMTVSHLSVNASSAPRCGGLVIPSA
jgi:hypothetical protein